MALQYKRELQAGTRLWCSTESRDIYCSWEQCISGTSFEHKLCYQKLKRRNNGLIQALSEKARKDLPQN